MKFYILMIDFGGKRGLEAVVQPELTRQNIVDQVRDIISEDRNMVAFVKFVDGNYIEDVTEEILASARFDDNVIAIERALDRQQAQWDHFRDLLKHASAE